MSIRSLTHAALRLYLCIFFREAYVQDFSHKSQLTLHGEDSTTFQRSPGKYPWWCQLGYLELWDFNWGIWRWGHLSGKNVQWKMLLNWIIGIVGSSVFEAWLGLNFSISQTLLKFCLFQVPQLCESLILKSLECLFNGISFQTHMTVIGPLYLVLG